jgi:multiple sugar transport system permease protein
MKLRPKTRKLLLGLLFTAPFTIGFLGLTVYPLLASLYYSFTRYAILTPPKWVGMNNYVTLFTKDDLFWKSLWNTAYYTMMFVPASLILSFALALALNVKVRGMSAYRTIYFLPTLVPSVALAILWLWLFNPQYGLLNEILALFGVPPLGWIADPKTAMPSMVIMGLWTVGQTVVIFLAGLQDVPIHLYEAAEIDGAGTMQKVFNVTIPLMAPVILFNLLVGIIASFQTFTQAYIMTNGGPANATLFYVLNLYRNGFQYVKMGYASALAWILFLIILACTVAVLRLSRGRVYYGGTR